MSFQAAVAKANAAKGSNKKLTNDQLLQLYAHFKQSQEGSNATPQPGLFDLKARAKHNAWRTLGNMTKAQAETKYIQLVQQWC